MRAPFEVGPGACLLLLLIIRHRLPLHCKQNMQNFLENLKALGAVHKGRPQSGGGGLSSADNLRTKVELQMRTSALFGAKKLWIFCNLWHVRTDKGGWANADKRGEVNFFAILCGRLLWTTPYHYYFFVPVLKKFRQ